MAMSMSGIRKVKKVICEKVVKSNVKGASVGRGRKGAASSVVLTSSSGTQEIRQGVGNEHIRSADQAVAVQVLPVQTRQICGRDCGTHMLNSGCWYSESESEWLDAEVKSASSVTTAEVRSSLAGCVGRSDGCDTPRLDKKCLAQECDWIKDKRKHDKRTSEATGKIARYRKIAWKGIRQHRNRQNSKDIPMLQ